MELDQQTPIYQVKPFNRSSIDLNRPASTVEEYMRQVVVSRESLPTVSVAENYASLVNDSKLQVQKKIENSKAILPLENIPKKEWISAKIDFFSWQRSKLEGIEKTAFLINGLNLPDAANAVMWCKICFEEKPSGIQLNPTHEKTFAHHKGIPPTLSFIKSLNDNMVNHLILHQVEYILNKNGFDKPKLEWLYSLLLVVKKPLLHDVVAALRNFARACQQRRATLKCNETESIMEYSLFIAIISVYFVQKDLADPC